MDEGTNGFIKAVIIIFTFYILFSSYINITTEQDQGQTIVDVQLIDQKYSYECFTRIAKWREGFFKTYRIVYANDTKVMYFINSSNCITPLYNADGTLQIYKELNGM